jgi:uncharacterized protein (TIGR03000 family)
VQAQASGYRWGGSHWGSGWGSFYRDPGYYGRWGGLGLDLGYGRGYYGGWSGYGLGLGYSPGSYGYYGSYGSPWTFSSYGYAPSYWDSSYDPYWSPWTFASYGYTSSYYPPSFWDYLPGYSFAYLPSNYFDYPYVGTNVVPDSGSKSYGASKPTTSDEGRVRIDVRLPQSDAQVWFQGNKTKQTGTERAFLSPPLSPGGEYVYEITARWMEKGKEVTQKRSVPVHPGERVKVDFTRAE